MDNSTIIAIAISAFIIISGALLWYLNRERQRVFKKYGKPTLEIDFGRTFFYNNSVSYTHLDVYKRQVCNS